MTITKRVERVLKDLDKLSSELQEASINCQPLEEKIVILRNKKMIESARHSIRKEYFAFEDCEKHMERKEVAS